jgi:hypothetical protein
MADICDLPPRDPHATLGFLNHHRILEYSLSQFVNFYIRDSMGDSPGPTISPSHIRKFPPRAGGRTYKDIAKQLRIPYVDFWAGSLLIAESKLGDPELGSTLV